MCTQIMNSEKPKGIYKLLIQLPLKSESTNKITFNFSLEVYVLFYNEHFYSNKRKCL